MIWLNLQLSFNLDRVGKFSLILDFSNFKNNKNKLSIILAIL